MRLHDSHPVRGGGRVRLRLPRPADRAGLHELLRDLGVAADDLDVRRALRCTPGRRIAICATAWEGGHERLAAFGAVDLERGAVTLLGPPAVTDVVRAALREHAGPWSRRVA